MTASRTSPSPDEAQDRHLAALLDAERHALIKGDFSHLPELTREKEARLALYAAHPGRLRNMPRLLAALRRNHDLLDRAMQGITLAQGRLASHQALLQQMETYDPTGRKTRIGQATSGSIQRKF